MVARNAVEARVDMENLNLRPSCWCPSRHVGPCATQAVSGFPSCSCCLYQPAPTHINHSSHSSAIRTNSVSRMLRTCSKLTVGLMGTFIELPTVVPHRSCSFIVDAVSTSPVADLGISALLTCWSLSDLSESKRLQSKITLVWSAKCWPLHRFNKTVGSAQKPNLNAPVDRTIHEGVKISCCLK